MPFILLVNFLAGQVVLGRDRARHALGDVDINRGQPLQRAETVHLQSLQLRVWCAASSCPPTCCPLLRPFPPHRSARRGGEHNRLRAGTFTNDQYIKAQLFQTSTNLPNLFQTSLQRTNDSISLNLFHA